MRRTLLQFVLPALLILTSVFDCVASSTSTANAGFAASSQRRTTQRSTAKRRLRKPDVIYYSTPPETVDAMLRVAAIKPNDVLYDLGSGDGRIPIAAAKQYGIHAVGIEIDPKLVVEAQENARHANVASLVKFRNDDMFVVSYKDASVVTLYLSEKLNLLLLPKLLRELRPGSRIVSHDFRMGDWKPEQTVRVPWGKGFRTVYLWIVPSNRRAEQLKSRPRNPYENEQTTSSQKRIVERRTS